jgi:hypothetical protein
MTFTVGFGQQFLKEWPQFDADQKARVSEFVALVQKHGLVQAHLPGKLTPSWIGAGQPNFQYAQQHSLWHYHLGYPSWTKHAHAPWTSDWVIHFQHLAGSSHVDVLDLYTHYDSKGNFYLPRSPHLTP